MNDLSTKPLQTLVKSSNRWSFPIETWDLAAVKEGYGVTDKTPDYWQTIQIKVPQSMSRCIVRTDTNEVLGVHGSKYKAVKHDDVVNSVFDAVDAAGISNDYNHMIKTYDNGAKLKGIIRFNDLTIEPSVGDIVAFQLTFFNSYDGTWAFQQSAEGLRLDCLNGMVSQHAVAKTWQKHTANIDVKASASKLQAALDQFLLTKEQYWAWQRISVTDQEAENFFKQKVSKIKNNTSTFKWNERQLDNLMDCWFKDSAALGKNKWALYNALTYWSSHTEDSKSPANTQRLREGVVAKAINKWDWQTV